MFRKNIIVVFFAGLLAFLSVFCFYRIQERDFMIKLNNHNLSADAFKFTLKDNVSLAQLNQKIQNNPRIDDIQLHYQDKQNKNITYFFGKGDFETPPMISGNFFSKNDFSTQVTVAVVGKNLAKKLYRPKDQEYLLLNGQYIPVLGIMGDKEKSQLDNQIFISCSQNQLAQMNTANYNLVLDGYQPLAKKTVQQVFDTASLKKLVSQKLILSNDAWFNLHRYQIIGLMLILLVFIGCSYLWILSLHRSYQAAKFIHKKRKQFVFESWEAYCLSNGIGIILGVLVGIFIYSLNSYLGIFLYNIVIFLICSCLFYIILNIRTKKEE